MQARFYMPVWGRFASPDPGMDQHLDQTQSWNLHSYVQNNPVMMIDANGMETQLAIGGRFENNIMGHAALIINGKAYSYGTHNAATSRFKGDWGVDKGTYLKGEVEKGRETTLLTLNLSPEKEKALQEKLEQKNPNEPGQPGYNKQDNNCVTPLVDAMESTGVIQRFDPLKDTAAAMMAPGLPAEPRAKTPAALQGQVGTAGLVTKTETVGKTKTGFWKSLLGSM